MNEFFELFAKFNSEFMGLLFFLMLTFFSGVIFYFIYFRKNFSSKIHQVPESILNNIGSQTSSPKDYNQLSTHQNESLKQEINRLNQELSDHKSRLEKAEKLGTSKTLSSGEVGTEVIEENKSLRKEVADLTHRLDEIKNSGAIGPNNQKLIEENEELELRLREYEIIEKDLANLKQIQDENTRLKELIRGKDLESQFLEEFPQKEEVEPEEERFEETQSKVTGVDEEIITSNEEELVQNVKGVDEDLNDDESSGITEAAPEAEEKSDVRLEETSEQEQVPASADDSKPEVKAENSEEDQLGEVVEIEKDGKEKSADELLSEFEKMLG
jgi:hypothetical protein